MKCALLKFLMTAVVLAAQPGSSNFVPLLPRGPGPLLESIQDRGSVPLGRLSGSAAARGVNPDIFGRQEECENAGYVPCSNLPENCCPSGYNCFSSGCCPDSPAGLEPCPNSQWCYIPASEICCANGSCPDGDTCCANQCCKSIAYCGSDGYCSACPPATETETATTTYTTVNVVQVTVTEVEEPEEASDFTCLPMTVTNAQNATLELDTDCALSYNPPSTTSTRSAAAVPAIRNAALGARQASCTPFETDTEVVTMTSTVTSQSTATTTVFTSPSESEFSCPTMAVTNSAGDVLSLDDTCGLEFSPATSSSSTASATTGNNNPGGGSSQKSTGRSIQSLGANRWRIAIVGFLGFLML